MNEPILKFNNLIVKRGKGKNKFQLKLKPLCINKGEKIAITGPSGSGKSTFLEGICGLHEIEGNITIGKHKINELDHQERALLRREIIGLVFQNFELIDYLNAVDNIQVTQLLNPSGDNDYLKKSLNLLTKMGIKKKAYCLPDTLSHGEKQRVSICRALIKNPVLIIADEPTASLDIKKSKEVIDLLIEEINPAKNGLILSTHDHSILDKFDRILSMESLLEKDTDVFI